MQTVSNNFVAATLAPMRRIRWSLLVSFEKTFDAGISFFTIGSSDIGGTDVLKGVGSVVQEWEKYNYSDYSSRVLNIEYNREMDPPTSPVTMTTCDITLDNHDGLFTPTNTASPLYGKLENGRPVRLSLGFGNLPLLQMFIGLTQGPPDVDERNGTARIHCVDFLRHLQNTELNEEVMYLNKRVDEIISGLLQTAGLLTSQFSLDVASAVIPFGYFKKGTKLLEAIRELVESDLGALYMDENGIIRYENRTNWATKSQVWSFDKSTVIEKNKSDHSAVINTVEVHANVSAVQENQKIWEASTIVIFTDNTDYLAPGQTKEVFANFMDENGEVPVTSVDDPDYITGATTSFFETNERSDGTGATLAGDVVLASSEQFSTSFKMSFTNNGSSTAYITRLEVFGTPAIVVKKIYTIHKDQVSIGQYEESPHRIENNFIQNSAAASSIANILLQDRANPDNRAVLLVKAVPQLQVGDVVAYDDDISDQTYFVTRINGIVNSSGFRQTIGISKRTINQYFRIGISTIGGSDVLAP
jgi:hypothetical protein